MFAGEHIKNWRKRYFILRQDGAFLGYRTKPEHGLGDPLNDFTVKGQSQGQITHPLPEKEALIKNYQYISRLITNGYYIPDLQNLILDFISVLSTACL